jgi:hypothetical protein
LAETEKIFIRITDRIETRRKVAIFMNTSLGMEWVSLINRPQGGVSK